MTTPVYISSGTFTNGLANISVNPPTTYASGDLLLLVVQTSNETTSTPSGWTLIANAGAGTPNSADGVGIWIFGKIATASETAVTVLDTGNHTLGNMYSFRYVGDFANIITNTNSVNTASATYTANAITTTYPDNLCVVVMGNAVDSNTPSSPSSVTASGVFGTFTLIESDNSNSGSGGGWSISSSSAQQGLSGIGSSGTITGTGTSSTQANITLALPPVYSRKQITT